MIAEEYVIGTSPMPWWVRGKLLPFKKMDGSVGYEWRGHLRTYDLNIGDSLIRYGREVHVNRKVRGD